MGWLVSGELFDHGRTLPVLSVLLAIGVLVCLWRWRDERARLLLGFTAVGLVMFCGRGVLGPVVDHVLPGGKELLLHRFLIGLQFGGLVLAGVGASFLAHAAFREGRKRLPAVHAVPAVAVLLVLGLVVLAPAWRERAHYNALDAQNIDAQQVVDQTDGRAFTYLATQASNMGGGRIYAGAPASVVQERIGQVPTYIYLLDDDVDAVGFGLRTLSISSDVEVRFNDSSAAQFNLFNIRWLILPTNVKPAVPATAVSTAGRWQLWQVPTTGYLQVVDTLPAIEADRTNIGLRTAPFLGSTLPAQGLIPLIKFAGGSTPTPTDPSSTSFSTPPGSVTSQFDRPDDGVFGGDVTVARKSVVMLKATYDPRWEVTVDGKRADTQMLAPSFIGVPVSPGTHHIEFKYVPYPYYWVLLTIGGLTLLGMALAPRRLDRRRREALERSTES
jgi:hypothetical protein